MHPRQEKKGGGYWPPPSLPLKEQTLLLNKNGAETIVAIRGDFPEITIMALSGGGHIEPKDHLKVAEQSVGAKETITQTFERQGGLLAIVRKNLESMLAQVSRPQAPPARLRST